MNNLYLSHSNGHHKNSEICVHTWLIKIQKIQHLHVRRENILHWKVYISSNYSCLPVNIVLWTLIYHTLLLLFTVLEIKLFRSFNRSSKLFSCCCSPSYLTSPCSIFWITFNKSAHNLQNIETKVHQKCLCSGHYTTISFCFLSIYNIPLHVLNCIIIY